MHGNPVKSLRQADEQLVTLPMPRKRMAYFTFQIHFLTPKQHYQKKKTEGIHCYNEGHKVLCPIISHAVYYTHLSWKQDGMSVR